MPFNKTYSLYKLMEDEDSVLSFKGIITEDLLAYVLQIMESNMSGSNHTTQTKKRVYSILIECIQNLYYHNELREEISALDRNHSAALIVVTRREDKFEIKTGNYILNERAEQLAKRITYINQLSRIELRNLYREVLTNGEVSLKGGAGLGLIDIARKSRNKLECHFQPMNSEFSFFSLNIRIN